MFPVLFVQHDVILDLRHIALHEDVVIAGEDGVHDNAEDRGDGQGGKRDVGAADLEGQATGEAQTGHQDHCRDNQVSGAGEVDPILDDISHANGRDHPVEDEGNASDDGGRHGGDYLSELRGEGEDNGVEGGEADDLWVMYLGEL